jgi:phosphogluconate dehydratase
MSLNSTVDAVTDRIRERSRASRDAYLARCRAAAARKPRRGTLSCGNLAHGFAACGASEKAELAGTATADIAIVSS